MAKEWAFVNPAWDDHPAQADGKHWTNIYKDFALGAGGGYVDYDPPEIPYKGCFNLWAGSLGAAQSNITAEYEFVAPCFMILDKLECQIYIDVGLAVVDQRATLIINVNGRDKRIDRAHPPQKYMDIPFGPNKQWTKRILDVRPVVVKPNDTVKIKFQLSFYSSAAALVMRLADCRLFFRASVRLNWSFSARSWLTARRELLPEDRLIVTVSGVDEENGLTATGYPVKLWHGPTSPPTIYVGEVVISSPESFTPFQVRSSVGSEFLNFTSDGNDDYLGIGLAYGPYETDDPPYDAFISATDIVFSDIVSVEKRVPKIIFEELLAELKLGERVNFSGWLEDPYQPDLTDFLGAISLQVTRNGTPVAFGSTDSVGGFLLSYTPDLAGSNFSWQILSLSSVQYKPGSSRVQVRTVWEIITTILDMIGPTQVKLGELINLQATLTPAVPYVDIIFEKYTPTGWVIVGTAKTDSNGKSTFNIDTSQLQEGTLTLRARFPGYELEPYRYEPSTSMDISVLLVAVFTGLSLRVSLDDQPLTVGDWESLTFDIEGVGTFHEPQVVEVTPGTYNITCTLVAEGQEFPPQTLTKTVSEGEVVPVEFMFYTPVPPPPVPPPGRLLVSATPSKYTVTIGEPIDVYVATSIIGVIRTIPFPFSKVALMANGHEVDRRRSDVTGKATLSWTPVLPGKYNLSVEAKLFLDKPLATSNVFSVRVV